MTKAGQILYLICDENSTPRGSNFMWNIIPVWVFPLFKKKKKNLSSSKGLFVPGDICIDL